MEQVDKKFCKDCKYYDKQTKICAVKRTYTARKLTCEQYSKRK